MAVQGRVHLAYSEELAQRARIQLSDRSPFSERRMFGGLAFMVSGHMCCGIVGDEFMVRVGPEAYDEALLEPHAREMDFTGKALKGMVFVAMEGVEGDDDLGAWIARGVEFIQTLPPK